jgi:hypothetical protein
MLGLINLHIVDVGFRTNSMIISKNKVGTFRTGAYNNFDARVV